MLKRREKWLIFRANRSHPFPTSADVSPLASLFAKAHIEAAQALKRNFSVRERGTAGARVLLACARWTNVKSSSPKLHVIIQIRIGAFIQG
jgi:hypothetical protein